MSAETVHLIGWALVGFGVPMFFFCIYKIVQIDKHTKEQKRVKIVQVDSNNNVKSAQYITVVDNTPKFSKREQMAAMLEKCGKGLEGVGTIPSMNVDNIFAPQC